MNRRTAIRRLATFFLTTASLAQAQQPGKMFRIGFLDPSDASSSAVLLKAFWEEIRRLGWVEGKNMSVEYRFAEEKMDRLPELAADLVRRKVDVIVCASTSAALGAATSAKVSAETSVHAWNARRTVSCARSQLTVEGQL